MTRIQGSILALLLVCAAMLPGCSGGKSTSATGGDPANEVVAHVGDQSITLADLETHAVITMKRLEQERYDALKTALDEKIEESLLAQAAAAENLTPDELVQREVSDRIKPPSEQNIKDFFDENRARMPADTTLDKMRPRLAKFLQDQAETVLHTAYVAQLRADLGAEVMLYPPRTEVTLPAGTPVRGPETAPITMVEFADFQCPYCKAAYPTVERLLLEYPDQIKFAFVDFPLPNHTRALPSSSAARCADDQGRFWDYYQALMLTAGDLGDDDLKARATDIGLELDLFESCLQGQGYEQAVTASREHGMSLGIDSTPTFFINGRMVKGAKSYEIFKAVIEEELAAANSGG